MPKLPPPPRTAENRSGFSVVLDARLAVGRHHIDREQVVDGHAEAPGQPPDAAARDQAADAGVGDRSHCRNQVMRLGFPVDEAEQAAARDPRRLRARVDAHAGHARQIDHHAAVAGRLAGEAVAAAFDRNQHLVLAREVHRRLDVDHAGGHDDHGRMFVDGGIAMWRAFS